MIVKLAAHSDQIRYWAQSALNAFKTLDQETAIEVASADLAALLAYLDRTDDAVTVLGVVPVETRVRVEPSEGLSEKGHLRDLKVVRP